MRETIDATMQELKSKRMAMANELAKVDAQIEVLSEVLTATRSNNGHTKKRPVKVGKELSDRSAKMRQIVLDMEGQFTTADVIPLAQKAGLEATDVYVALQSLRQVKQVKVVGSRIGETTGRLVNVYKVI